MKNEITITAIILGSALITLSFWLGFSLKEVTPPQTIKETQYILQQCEPAAIDYAKWKLEREKLIKELCPKGGILDNNYGIKCLTPTSKELAKDNK